MTRTVGENADVIHVIKSCFWIHVNHRNGASGLTHTVIQTRIQCLAREGGGSILSYRWDLKIALWVADLAGAPTCVANMNAKIWLYPFSWTFLSGAFENLTRLEELQMNGNTMLTQLEAGTFRSLESLQTIRCDWVGLESIQSGAFVGWYCDWRHDRADHWLF